MRWPICPEDFRVAVVLRDVQGMDYAQIAEVLARPGGDRPVPHRPWTPGAGPGAGREPRSIPRASKRAAMNDDALARAGPPGGGGWRPRTWTASCRPRRAGRRGRSPADGHGVCSPARSATPSAARSSRWAPTSATGWWRPRWPRMTPASAPSPVSRTDEGAGRGTGRGAAGPVAPAGPGRGRRSCCPRGGRGARAGHDPQRFQRHWSGGRSADPGEGHGRAIPQRHRRGRSRRVRVRSRVGGAGRGPVRLGRPPRRRRHRRDVAPEAAVAGARGPRPAGQPGGAHRRGPSVRDRRRRPRDRASARRIRRHWPRPRSKGPPPTWW